MPHSVNTRQCPIRIEERSDISVILLTIFIFLEESVLLEGLLALYILMQRKISAIEKGQNGSFVKINYGYISLNTAISYSQEWGC